ncbi:18220_t:CDS:2, partial [Funneliformis geosporum]
SLTSVDISFSKAFGKFGESGVSSNPSSTSFHGSISLARTDTRTVFPKYASEAFTYLKYNENHRKCQKFEKNEKKGGWNTILIYSTKKNCWKNR